MRYTERQQEVVAFLEQLVHRRFSTESLNKALTMFLGETIKVENVTLSRIANGDEDELTDYNLMFDLEREDQYGYFDIYMLPLRKEGFDGSTMMITEVGYEFE
jgi:hypothetical protein